MGNVCCACDRLEYMTFPRNEWDSVERQLDKRGWCGTTRVEQEFLRWETLSGGTVLDSDVGRIRVMSVETLADALGDHPFRQEVAENPQWVEWLSGKPGLFIRFQRAPTD